jgi:formamidopyrimidine-DNA glycosylase
MPELPEVEVICRAIRPHLLGRTIVAVKHSGKRLRTPVPINELRQDFLHKEIIEIKRRAKYLLITVADEGILLIHLGMTGNLGFFPPERPWAKHDHVCFLLDNDLELRFNDSRRFGSIQVLDKNEAAHIEKTFFKKTGPEPFSTGFSTKHLLHKASGRKQPIKVFLMTNENVVGIGNIYASEILFAAGIGPTRAADSITATEWRKIIRTSRRILQKAIDCGGSTISDFIHPNRDSGYFQVSFKVYDRAGLPCVQCKGPIHNLQLGGRSSFYCPECQK